MDYINWFHVGLGAAQCLHALRDPSSVPSPFDSMWRCPRSISTIVCIHEPTCEPADCSSHGDCVQGECHCTGDFWSGPGCDILDCGPSNCSLHGVCTDGESLWHAKASNTEMPVGACGSSRGSTDLGSIYMGNIAYLLARHHGGASVHHCMQSWLVHRVLSHPGVKEHRSRELAPAVAASFAAGSSALWRGFQPREPSLSGPQVLIAWPARALTLEASWCCAPHLLSYLLGVWSCSPPFPPASEAAVEMVRTRCL